MRRSRKIVLGFVLVVVALIIAWKLIFPTYAYRYRMTVNVEADGKLYSGSSVIEVRLKRQPKISSEVPRLATEVSGEAVFVDLGSGKNIFAALASGPLGINYDYPGNVVPLLLNFSYSDEDLAKLPYLQGKWTLPLEQMPTFVTFTDLTNPETARVVAPREFDQVFGRGVSLQAVVIEMTTDTVTRTIEKTLPWLPHPHYLSGRSACGPGEPQCLDGGSFSRS